jgi:hypothetical protein
MSEIGEYVKKAKGDKSTLEEVMEKRKSQKLHELEEVQIEAMIAEAKKKIQTSGGDLQQGQSSNFISMLMYGRKPEEIKQILSSLDEAEIDKLAYLTSAMNGNQFGALTQVLRKPETNVKETIELINTIIKMNQKPAHDQGVDLKGIAEIFKAGVEAAKAQNPQQQQSGMDSFKMYHELFMKPFLDQLAGKDKENFELRMKELESRIVSPTDYIKHAKELAKEFGYSPSARNEIDIKLAEMAQSERLANRSLDWEMTKYEQQKESEKQLYSLIGKAVDGPIKDLTKSLGGAAAKRIEGGSKGSNVPTLMQIQCPRCQQPFDIIPNSPQVVCPHCKAILGLASQPPPPPEQTEEPIKGEESVRKPEPQK